MLCMNTVTQFDIKVHLKHTYATEKHWIVSIE